MKRRIALKRVRALVGTLLVVALVVIGWLLFERLRTDVVPAVRTNIDSTLLELEQQIPTEFSDYTVRRSGWTGQRDTGEGRGAQGYDFAVSSEADPGLVISPPLAGDEVRQPTHSVTSVAAFVERKLTESGFSKGQDFGGLETVKLALAKADSTCLLETAAQYTVKLTCSGPKIEQALAAQAQPFVKAYLKAHANLRAADMVYGPMVIRSQNPNGPIGKSQVAGYDLAEAVVAYGNTSSIALFYSKQGKWHYITESTDEFGFSCSDIMKDPDARKAYRHYWCYQRENDEGLRILDYNVH